MRNIFFFIWQNLTPFMKLNFLPIFSSCSTTFRIFRFYLSIFSISLLYLVSAVYLCLLVFSLFTFRVAFIPWLYQFNVLLSDFIIIVFCLTLSLSKSFNFVFYYSSDIFSIDSRFVFLQIYPIFTATWLFIVLFGEFSSTQSLYINCYILRLSRFRIILISLYLL